MLNSLPVRLLWRSLNHLTRLTLVTSGIIALLCAITIIVLRYWLLPDIEQFHDRITTSLSAAIGNPVTIGKIQGDWQGLHPHLSLSDVRILDNERQPALVLPDVEASVSWLSLLASELRLASLEIDQPELLIRRDHSGKVFIGSVAIEQQGSNNDLSNWLLHQSRIVVRNAVIVWIDEQRDAPALVLDKVNLRIENLFRHHQFALRAAPPAELATPLDVRGDFHGRSFDRPNEWSGQLFTQLDYTDLLAWRPWLKLPAQLNRGRGALRGWLGIEKGSIARITADMALHDVSTRLADNVPEMDVHYLRGRAAWKLVEDGWEVSTRNLAMRLHNGLQMQPTDFYFRSIPVAGTHPASGELRANLLHFESLVSLANFLPLDAGLRKQLDAYGPRGRVSNLELQWQGMPEKLLSYKIKGQFDDLALRQVASMPGFSGLSVAVDGSDKSGSLNITTRDMTLDAPGVMREALRFDTLTGQLKWQRTGGELSINMDNVAIANEDLAGNLFGSYQTKSGTLGLLDLTISLTRGDIRRSARYSPLFALAQKDNDWLNDALLSGHTEDFRLRLKGNLSDFPLDGTKDALFEINAHGQNVSMQFAPDWPKIENLSGEVLIKGNKLEVHAPASTMLGSSIHDLDITVSDMTHPEMPLEIKGKADAPNNNFLQFIQQSPVRGYIKGFTDGMSASGNGHLELTAYIPLLGNRPANVSGSLQVKASDINLGAGVPWLRGTQGTLSFTESGMKATDVTAAILGGPARLNISTAEGGIVNASVQGRVNLDALQPTETHPLLDYLHGSTAWNANISVLNKTAQVVVTSTLQGIRSNLPSPLNKSANEIWPLHVEKKSLPDQQDEINAQLAKLVSVRFQRKEENGTNTIKRGMIVFGGQGKPANVAPVKSSPAAALKTAPVAELRSAPSTELRTGLWFSGRLSALSLQGWDGVFSGSSHPALPLAGGNLRIDKLTGYGLNLQDIQINATKRGDGMAAQISSTPLNGEIVWQPQGFNGTGKVTAHLRNMYWPAGEPSGTPSPLPEQSTIRASPPPHDLPAVEIAVEDFQFKGKQIGRFDLVGYPEGQDWRLRRLRITNPDGSLTGDGLWLGGGGNKKTRVNLMLEISNAGKILERSGYPGTVRNGSGKLSANLSWDGQPDEFNYATLNGALKLDTGKGQFLKMDPGMGKLLSILSLQALPKRITLDFTDVFSSGFEFDNINGNATINQGVMQTQDLHIEGSSAKVTMKGNVNLNNETQDMRVEILPTLGESISLLSAFAGGPVVGIGALIVSKVLGNPLDKLVSFEYNVSGTWNNPNVTKLGAKPVTPSPVTAKKLQQTP